MKLELDGLTKEFGDFTAVNHINLTMTNGVYGLLGVNGAGKTTLMRMLCTLLKPTSGTICCNGKDIFSLNNFIHFLKTKKGPLLTNYFSSPLKIMILIILK